MKILLIGFNPESQVFVKCGDCQTLITPVVAPPVPVAPPAPPPPPEQEIVIEIRPPATAEPLKVPEIPVAAPVLEPVRVTAPEPIEVELNVGHVDGEDNETELPAVSREHAEGVEEPVEQHPSVAEVSEARPRRPRRRAPAPAESGAEAEEQQPAETTGKKTRVIPEF